MISSAGSKRAWPACAHNGGWPPDDTEAWLSRSMDAARRRELARADMTTPVECCYHGRDVTTAEMALLRSLSAGPSALSRRPAPG